MEDNRNEELQREMQAAYAKQECLRLAAQNASDDAEQVVDRAKKYWAFIREG